MTAAITQMLAVARRDFLAIVRSPSFLFFLLGPLLMVGFSLLGAGAIGGSRGKNTDTRLVVMAAPADIARFKAAEPGLRALAPPSRGFPPVVYETPPADPAREAARRLDDADVDTLAVLYGPLDRPTILRKPDVRVGVAFLTRLAADAGADDAHMRPAATVIDHVTRDPGRNSRNGLAFGGVIAIFMLTLLIAGQAIGMLAEEKGNKIIEVLAAAAPLEAVFFGKLLAMLGVAVLVAAFWGVLGGLALIAMPQALTLLLVQAPAVRWPMFTALLLVYFVTAFLLNGALYIGVGAQAATPRDIQMVTLPLTMVQIGMLTLAQAASHDSRSAIARAAEIFPFSSSMGMIARAAHDPALWPHPLALVWQLLWIAAAIWLGARLFRTGVLSGGAMPWRRMWRQLRGKSG